MWGGPKSVGSLGQMRMNTGSQMNPVNPIGGKSGSSESMLSAIKNKRKHNALKMQMSTTSQEPLNLSPGVKVGDTF